MLVWLAASGVPAGAAEDDVENRFAGGAPLKTDPELEAQMKRAEKFAEDKEYGYAATVWQYVLDKSGDTLMTRDGRTYTSLSEEVERALAKLPPEALRVYRITADGEAKAILAQAENEEDALSEVVRRYFVSSYGDEAAYKLGCLALDRHDFVGASRMLSKLLELHPDSSIPKAEVLLRLAVAAARVGDKAAARQFVAEAEQLAGSGAAGDLAAVVKGNVEAAGSATVVLAASGRGHMPALPPTVMSSTLTELWSFAFPTEFSLAGGQAFGGPVMYSGPVVYEFSGRMSRVGTNVAPVGDVLNRWKSQVWRPAGQLVFADDMVLFKTNNDLVGWTARGIGEKTAAQQRYWRSAWLNSFRLDAATQMFINMGIQQQGTNRPFQPGEVMLFGDRVHQAMSVADGVVYNLEGQRTPRYGGSEPQPQVQQPQHWGVMPRRTRRNWLAAYDARTGKALWYRSAADTDDETAEIGFLAAPVPYGKLLLAPVSDSGTIWMYALSRADGATVWKSYLCDEPTGGCSPWSPAGVAIEGRDAYVVCGTGVAFALDAVSGHIRYAVRYERHGSQNQAMRNAGYGGSQMLDLVGWEDDVVIPHGRALVVMASDHDRLIALDRRSGKMLWESPRTPFDHPAEYCVGAADGALYVGGRNVVRRYDITSGLLKWETVLDDSFGRAALTEDALYVPVKDGIWKLDLAGGKVLGKVGVSLTTDDMVGNLYSDGERIWVQGGNRVYVLTNLEHRLALLEKRIALQDPTALLERMRLWAKGGETAKAVADLETAHDLFAAKQGAGPAAAALLEAMSEIHLAQVDPRTALRLAADRLANLGGGSADEQGRLASARRNQLTVALATIRRKNVPAAVEILSVAAQFDDDLVRRQARQALAACATAADAARLQAAVESADPLPRIIAADALGRSAGAAAKPVLAALLAEPDPRLQLAGARALANLGDRDSLAALVKLLESDDLKLRSESAQVLFSLAGERFGFVAYDKPEARGAAVAKWRDWLASKGESAALKFPVPDVPPPLGRTLVSFYQQNVVIEYNEQREEVWRLSANQPWSCQGLPDGHRLIAFYAENKVVEYDETGKPVWTQQGLPGNPFGARRLENGNTLIACSDSEQVVEYKPDHSIAWQKQVTGRPMDAKRLENGNTLICLSNANNVVELDPDGNTVWQVGNMNGPIKAQRLENGNTLIAQMNSGSVVEVNREGTIVWRRDGFSYPYDAQRLPSGGTLIIDNGGVREIDADGKEVWQQGLAGGSGVSSD
jgi:outer membrane protein assembly factor BamB